MDQRIFETFLAEHTALIDAIVRRRIRPADRDDAMQEVLVAIWRAFPRIDNHKNVTRFLRVIARNCCVSFYERTNAKKRRGRGRSARIDSEDGAAIVEWASFHEWTKIRRERESPPPEACAYAHCLGEADRGLIQLARALVRSGSVIGVGRGYKFFMSQWLPDSWDDPGEVIRLWSKRLDNARSRSINGSEVGSCGCGEGDARLNTWVRKDLPKVLQKIERGGLPHLRRDHASRELTAWRFRAAAILRNESGRAHPRVEPTFPDWIWDGHDDYRACVWIRRNWTRWIIGVRDFGLATWDEKQRKIAARTSRRWQAENQDTVTGYLHRPDVMNRRRAYSREWARAQRAQRKSKAAQPAS